MTPKPTHQLYHHLENPTRQPWSDICTVIENSLHLPTPITSRRRRRLDYREWLARIDAGSDLLEFLKDHFLHMSSGDLVLDVRNTLAVSRTLRSTGAVKIETVGLYLEFWRERGLI